MPRGAQEKDDAAEDRDLCRRDREKLRQRKEIIAAALALFSEKGYHNVSVQEVAERSEFAIGTLYKFFKNKESLYETLILENSRRFHDTLMRSLEKDGDEVETLKEYVRTVFALFQDSASTIRLYFTVTRGILPGFRSDFDRTIKANHLEVQQRLVSVIERGIRKKRFLPIADPRDLAMAIHSAATGFLFHWMEDPESHPLPEDPDVILNMFFKGMLSE